MDGKAIASIYEHVPLAEMCPTKPAMLQYVANVIANKNRQIKTYEERLKYLEDRNKDLEMVI